MENRSKLFNPHIYFDLCCHLELVEVLALFRDTLSETLTLSHSEDSLVGLVIYLERRSGHGLPVIERALWEGLTTSVGTKISSETERFHDREVSKEGHLRGSRSLLFGEDVTTTTSENTVNVTHGILWD